MLIGSDVHDVRVRRPVIECSTSRRHVGYLTNNSLRFSKQIVTISVISFTS